MMTIENTTGGVITAMMNNTASHGGIAKRSRAWFDI